MRVAIENSDHMPPCEVMLGLVLVRSGRYGCTRLPVVLAALEAAGVAGRAACGLARACASVNPPVCGKRGRCKKASS